MAEDRIIITDELLAAFLDGNVSGREVEAIMQAADADSSLRETISILSALAADAPDKLCAIHCERYVLQCFGISSSVDELLSYACEQDLIKDDGMPLGNVGRVSEHYGLTVENKFAFAPPSSCGRRDILCMRMRLTRARRPCVCLSAMRIFTAILSLFPR